MQNGSVRELSDNRALQAAAQKSNPITDGIVLSGALMRLRATASVGGRGQKSRFEAFFTSNPQGSGAGLGLEIVHRTETQDFDGTIEVESEPGNARFIVRLPLDGSAKAESQAKPD